MSEQADEAGDDRALSEAASPSASPLDSLEPVDPSNRIPLYLQVISNIETAIRRKLLPPGTRLPAEDELRAAFNVSRTTLRRAIGTLVQQGVVERRHGSGTWIARQILADNSLGGLQNLYRELSAVGRHPETDVLSLKTVEASPTLSEETGFAVGDPLYAVTRLRSADGEPVTFERCWFPISDLVLTPEDLEGSLDSILRAHGSVPASIRQVLTPRLASEEEGRALGIGNVPVIVSQLWAQDSADQPLWHTSLTFSPTGYRFQVTHFPDS